MKTSSPLRYPGGKSAMTGLLGAIRRMNNLGDYSIAEPFAGGAGASLGLLYLEETPSVLINDVDPAIHDFWWSLLNKSSLFIRKLDAVPVSVDEWRKQRKIYRSTARASRIGRGFSAFYLNRCNRSGIVMNGGPIGGIEQAGKWKIDARFNKEDLRRRCEKVYEFRDRISVSNNDGLEFISEVCRGKTFLFIDPPYFEKGSSLYLNSLDEAYHQRLASKLKRLTSVAWVLTYDDCQEIRDMYSGWASVKSFDLRYTASERRKGKELMITPKGLSLPSTQRSASIGW